MQNLFSRLALILTFACVGLFVACANAEDPTNNWPRFRGPDGNGVSAQRQTADQMER